MFLGPSSMEGLARSSDGTGFTLGSPLLELAAGNAGLGLGLSGRGINKFELWAKSPCPLRGVCGVPSGKREGQCSVLPVLERKIPKLLLFCT